MNQLPNVGLAKTDTTPGVGLQGVNELRSVAAFIAHLSILSIVVLYIVISERSGLYLLAPPIAGIDRIVSRCAEGMLLWTCSYCVLIWAAIAPRRPIFLTTRGVWYAAVVPVLMSAFAAAAETWRQVGGGPDYRKEGLWEVYLAIAPLGFGIGLALVIGLQARLVKRLVRNGSRVASFGTCSCGYNLTGNVSGVCPECGKAFRPTEKSSRD